MAVTGKKNIVENGTKYIDFTLRQAINESLCDSLLFLALSLIFGGRAWSGSSWVFTVYVYVLISSICSPNEISKIHFYFVWRLLKIRIYICYEEYEYVLMERQNGCVFFGKSKFLVNNRALYLQRA